MPILKVNARATKLWSNKKTLFVEQNTTPPKPINTPSPLPTPQNTTPPKPINTLSFLLTIVLPSPALFFISMADTNAAKPLTFKCIECTCKTVAFPQKNRLVDHYKNAHNGHNHFCQFCGNGFKNPNAVLLHQNHQECEHKTLA